MTNSEALNELYAGQRELGNLATLLQVMELAAEAQGAGGEIPEIDWWALVEVAKRQLGSISPHLNKIETFLLQKPTK